MEAIPREEGRRLFGTDPAGYDRARPGHPPRVYEVLVERCGLVPGTAVLEIGPGTGQATRRLLELGAAPLVAVEPDAQLAAHLRDAFGERVDVRETTIEDASLPAESFGLAAAASSFHWVDEGVGLGRIFDALRPGGWVALWWTLFGDDEPDAFIDATSPLLRGLEREPDAGRERAAAARSRRGGEIGGVRQGRVRRPRTRARRLGGELGHGRDPRRSTGASRRSSGSTTVVGRRSWTRSRSSPSGISAVTSAGG